MGRHRGSKKLHRRSCRRQKGHESNPELPSPRRPGRETRDTSPAWNSLDEESLADYASAAAASESTGEMEVTKRLSCLNFSVVPCAMDPANFDKPNIAGGGGEQESDTELVSELNSATHMEALLPGEGKEEDLNRRPNRKRNSRRRPNKKAKKMKNAYFPTWTSGHQLLQQHPGHVQTRVHEQCAREDKKRMPERRSTLSRARYNPVARAPSDKEESSLVLDVSIPCLYPNILLRRMEVEDCSDTSPAVCDMESAGCPGDEMISMPPDEAGDSMAVNGTCCLSCSCDDGGGGGGECVCDNESELSSDSTTDSGCDGDDEESSVEWCSAASGQKLRLSGWWDKESVTPSSTEDEEVEEKFSQILNGAFPLAATCHEDRPRSFQDRLALSEFKHPGTFGIRGSRRKKRRKPPCPPLNTTPKDINRRIAAFVKRMGDNSLQFEPVSRAMCRTISNLASAYNLDCSFEQKRRLPVASPLLRRTMLTRMPSEDEITSILRNHGRESPTALLSRLTLIKGVAGRPVPHGGGCPTGVVGGEAAALDDSNVGHRMLQVMGWVPGSGLGPGGSGLQEPIEATVRPRHRGLGYS